MQSHSWVDHHCSIYGLDAAFFLRGHIKYSCAVHWLYPIHSALSHYYSLNK